MASELEDKFQTLHEIVRAARMNLAPGPWDYLVGGTETETTLRRNRLGIDSLAFRPRVLRDVSRIDTGTTFFGRRLRIPVMMAPVGSIETFTPGGGATAAKASAAFGVPQMLSSACNPGLEATAAAADNFRIFQLYVRGDDAFVDDYVRRAMDNGYTAFAITVDVAHYSRRERDLAKRHVTAGRRRVQGREHQAALDWRTVDRVKKMLNIPLIIKGIHTAEDAKLCLEHGVDWIYVSNHGGRQLDHGRGSIEFLPEIVEVAKGRAKIMIDGGFYRGTDIVKALIMGADIVGLGRMQCYGLGAGGQEGVVRMLELLEDEVQRCLGLLGVNKFSELDASYLHPAAPTNPPHVFSAFPLLKIDDYHY